MRTMALYTLWFVFVFKILVVFVKQDQVNKLGQLVMKTVAAGLLISMSWFIIAALVDFSIVGTSAVASLPLQVLEQQWNAINKGDAKLLCYKKVKIDSKWVVDTVDLNEEANLKPLEFQDVMPSGDSVAGPLFFMGCGILNLFDFTNLTDDEVDFSDVLELNLIKLLIATMLFLPMVALMVINVMRIFFIWIWAMFWPFIILDMIFKGPLTKQDGAYKKYFDVKNIVGLIFQPVLVVGLMSVAMVLILGVYSWLSGRRDDIKDRWWLNDMCFEPTGTNSWRIGCTPVGEFIMDGALFQKSAKALVWGAIGELILVWFTIIILRWLFTIWFKANDITASTASKIFDAWKNLAKAVPFIPTGNGTSVGVGAALTAKDNLKRGRINKFDRKQSVESDRLMGMIGLGAKGTELRKVEESDLRSVSHYDASRPMAFWNKLNELRRTRDIPLSVLQPNLENWLSSGWYEWLWSNKWGTTYLPTKKPSTMHEIWSHNLFTRMINGYMENGEFKMSNNAKPKTLYRATGGSTN